MDKPHLLIADDEPGIRKALQIIFSTKGFRVSVASDGQQALDFVLAQAEGEDPVGLIITDVQMPRLNGLEFLERLREKGITPPTLVISGYGDRKTVADLGQRGFDHFVEKPFSPGQVIDVVNRMLEPKS